MSGASAAFAIGAMLWGISAFATTQNKAFLKARLVEFDAKGTEISRPGNGQELTLNVTDDKDAKPVSFTFVETQGPPPCEPGMVCMMMPVRMTRTEFRITRRVSMACGGVMYFAEEKARRPKKLQVMDNTMFSCESFARVTPWKVTLSAPRERDRHFTGEPVPVEDVAACLASMGSLMCPMIYQPSTCIAEGTKLSASGGNSCEATIALEAMACQHGLDPKSLDIQCETSVNP
jgi:hypothetical protein